MKALATWVMVGRSQAVLFIALAMFLSLLLPPVVLLSGAALALVTLRKGGGEGALVLAIAAAGAFAIGLLLFDGPGPVAGILPGFWLPVLVLATTLRSSVSLTLTVLVAVGLGWLVVLGFQLVLGDPGAWWGQVLDSLLKPALSDAGVSGEGMVTVEEILRLVAPLMPGVVAANALLSALCALLLGRWWQALLYNPGGLQREFHALRLGRVPAAVTGLLLVAATASRAPLLLNLGLVAGTAYAVQGLAIVHALVALKRWNRFWLLALYLALLFALPQVALGLCVFGLVDAWMDTRARVARSVSTGTH